MKRWPKMLLLDVASLARGTEPGSGSYVTSTAGTRFLRVGDITGKSNNPVYTNATKLVHVTEDDLLLALDGAPGHVSTGHHGAISSGIRKIKVLDKSILTSGWLRYVLNSPDIQTTIRQHTRGITILHASSALPHINVPVPPLEEQKRIVKLLDEADELRKLRTQADRRSADLIPALFHEMFGDPEYNPKGWPVFPFGELLAEPLRNGFSPAKGGSFSARVLTLSAITGNEFDSSAWKEASFARQPDKSCQTTANLFLICRGNGNYELVGRAKFPQRAAEGVVFPDTMIAGVPKADKLLPLFLEEAWKLPTTRSQISSGARTTNGTFKINQTIIEQIRLTVPPLPLQKEFAQRVGKIRALQAAQAASRQRTEHLFQSMLHRAFDQAL